MFHIDEVKFCVPEQVGWLCLLDVSCEKTQLSELCHSELFLHSRLLGHGGPGTVPEHARLLLPPGPCLHHGEGI